MKRWQAGIVVLLALAGALSEPGAHAAAAKRLVATWRAPFYVGRTAPLFACRDWLGLVATSARPYADNRTGRMRLNLSASGETPIVPHGQDAAEFMGV